jgi:hypothetical protein
MLHIITLIGRNIYILVCIYISSLHIMAGATEVLNFELVLDLLCKHVNKYKIE